MDIPLSFYIGGVLTLVGISAVFSSAETAITAASRAKLHQLSKSGNKHAKTIQGFQQNMGRTISALLMGNTLLNTFASMLANEAMGAVLGNSAWALLAAAGSMGILILVYAEVMPKIIAITNPEKTSLSLAPFLRGLVKCLAPFTRLIDAIARSSLSLLGVKISPNAGEASTIEELRGLIEMHQGPGEETAQEQAMLRSILDLTTVEVSEIMVHRQSVRMINDATSPADVLAFVLSSPHTRFPIWKDNPENVIGVLHTKALLRAIKAHRGEIDKLDISTIASKPWFIPESTTLLDQMQEFRSRREHFALVVDEYGALMGVVTLEDILEEIVGEIVDEHDVVLPGVKQQQNGSYSIAGTITLRDLERQLGWDLPDEEASTLAGLLLHEAREIPHVGQVFELYGFRFEVLRRKKNQITLVGVTPLDKA